MHEQDNGTILLPDIGGWAFCYATILHYWSKYISIVFILEVPAALRYLYLELILMGPLKLLTNIDETLK